MLFFGESRWVWSVEKGWKRFFKYRKLLVFSRGVGELFIGVKWEVYFDYVVGSEREKCNIFLFFCRKEYLKVFKRKGVNYWVSFKIIYLVIMCKMGYSR